MGTRSCWHPSTPGIPAFQVVSQPWFAQDTQQGCCVLPLLVMLAGTKQRRMDKHVLLRKPARCSPAPHLLVS